MDGPLSDDAPSSDASSVKGGRGEKQPRPPANPPRTEGSESAEKARRDPNYRAGAARAGAETAREEGLDTRPVQPSRPRAKSKRPKRGGSPSKLPLTVAAEIESEILRKKLFGLLTLESHVRGNRRRASALDVTDFQAAYDDLVNPRPRPVWIDVMGDAGLMLGGLFGGVGTNILTSDRGRPEGWVCVAASVFVSLFCILVKYLKLT